MRNIVLFFMLLFAVHLKINGQIINNELIDLILKSRANYVADSVPDVFKWHYEPLTEAGEMLYYNNTLFYDTLKNTLSETPFPESSFLWCEFIADDRYLKNIEICTDNYMVRISRIFIPLYHRKNPLEDSIVYELEIPLSLKNTLMEPFVKDFEEWNENVTNRSYLSGPGRGFVLCSKVTHKSDTVEIIHTAFRYDEKNVPVYYIREQPEDDYSPRVQANCDWITDDKREEIVLSELGICKEQGARIFDCDGKEIYFESITIEK